MTLIVETGVEERRGPGLASLLVAIAGGLLAALFYALALIFIGSLNSSDAAGNGMAAGFAVVAVMAVWVSLALYLVGMSWRSGLPRRVLVPTVFLAILAAVSNLIAVDLLDQQAPGSTWLHLVAVVLPWLAILFGLWVRTSAGVSWRSRLFGVQAAGALTLLLCAATLIAHSRWMAGAPAREAAMQAGYEQAMREQEQRERAARADAAVAAP